MNRPLARFPFTYPSAQGLVVSILISSFLFLSCGPSHDEDVASIDLLREQAEQLIRAQSEMGWDNWVFGKSSNQDSLYRLNENLFTKETIALVLRAQSNEPDEIQRKRLSYFRRYLTTEYISKQIAPLTDSVSNLEAALTISLDGTDIPYRQVSGMLARESNQKRREELYRATDPALDSLNGLLLRVEQHYQSISQSLGYRSYNEMIEDIKEIDLHAFKSLCERVLDESEQEYRTLLGEQIRSFPGLSMDNLYRYDTGRLFRNERFIPYFPADSLLRDARRTYAGMGIILDNLTNLHIDEVAREKKNPRAVCFGVIVPDDVRLSIKPNGGPDDFMALFHELGHGLHFAHTTEHAVEFKYMGEPTVTETYAFLSEYLVADQAWLREFSRMPVPALKEFVRFQAFSRLYFIRRYSAKFLYEYELHSGAPEPGKIYARTLSRGTAYNAIPSDEKRYLTDLDALYYSAGYLKAWFLEAQLSSSMTERFGTNWFENPEAGTFLKTLWAQGDRLTANELAGSIGFPEILPDPLLAKIESMILFSTP